jgi:hypothetical protein
MRMATFRCSHCDTLRPYGHNHHDVLDPLLNCETCKVPTLHHHVEENNDWQATADTRPGDEKILSITFKKASRE